MVAVQGIVGLRPDPQRVARIVAPPYDVVVEGSPLHRALEEEPLSVYHVILGAEPEAALRRLREEAGLLDEEEPSLYVLEQRWPAPGGGEERRWGVLCAVEVAPYETGRIRRHEKTFDHKVQGRLALRAATGMTWGPVFLLGRAPLDDLLRGAAEGGPPLYDFTMRAPGNDLDGVRHRVWRLPEHTSLGTAIRERLAPEPLYIADGHHRYHAALCGGQREALAYVTSGARILAYDRLVRGVRPFDQVRAQLPLEPVERFETPPKHAFCLHSREGTFLLRAQRVPEDVVGRLDCSILERELYPALGLRPEMLRDPAHFAYRPETDLPEMARAVDRGDYDLAIALHPVSVEDLMAVADAGLSDPDVVMPQKSTYFAPKLPTGLAVLRHTKVS